jgi:membrane protein implicated in regulation of membrane protease activity
VASRVVAFLIIGAVGLGVIVLALVLGEVLDGVFEAVDSDFGGGILSTPVLGAFLAAFGFGGALILYTADVGAAVAALGGLVCGAVVGGIALAIVRSLVNMPTDENVRTTDMVGITGTVVTRIPAGGLGEVTVRHAGQLLKLSARADEELRAGTPIVVTAVMTSSSVLVSPVTREQ